MKLTAGIFVIPALFFIWTQVPARCGNNVSPSFSPTLLEAISYTDWSESRGYLDIEDEEIRLEKVEEDTAFDAWLADRSREKGYSLNEYEQSILSKRESQLYHQFAMKELASQLELTEEEIQKICMARQWKVPIPEQWEVWYLFLDDTNAETQQEKETIRQRAEWLKTELNPGNFQKMARLWSDAPSSEEGGVLGLLSLETLGPTFSSHVRKTPVGQIGGPYRTRSGWNILYIRSYSPERPKAVQPEQIPALAAEVVALKKISEVDQSPELWRQLLKDLNVLEEPLIMGELRAYENYMLGKRYNAEQVRAVTASAQELRAIFKEKSESLVHEKRSKAREILVTSDDWTVGSGREDWLKRQAVRDRARQVRQRILDGEDFALVAREVSAGITAASGGELGWVQAPSSYVYDRTLSELEIDEISPPVRADRGYLLLQLQDVESGRPLSFEEARPLCERVWFARCRKQIESDLREQYKKERVAEK